MAISKYKLGAVLLGLVSLMTLGCTSSTGGSSQDDVQSANEIQSADANVTQSEGLAEEEIDPVDKIWQAMSDEQKVASVLMLHPNGTDFDAAKDFLDTYQPGGIILMGDNIPDDEQSLREAIDSWQQNETLPFLIGIDEEGGVVRRLEADDYPAAGELRDGSPNAVRDAFADRGALLESLGININFGVVADYSDNEDSFIYHRVLGTNPSTAASNVVAAVEGQKGKVLSTLKHFPGHGLTEEDSHVTVPESSISDEEWQEGAAVPFKAGIDAGADAVMVGSLLLPNIDDNPASLSPVWYGRLRDEGFTGLAVTDDMAMLRATDLPEYQDSVKNATRAINAGASLIVDIGEVSMTAPEFAEQMINGLTAALHANELSREALDDAGNRVLHARYEIAQTGQLPQSGS